MFPQIWITETVQNIQRKLHHESYGKLESGISRRGKTPCRRENPKIHLPGRFNLAIFISYSNYATQLYT